MPEVQDRTPLLLMSRRPPSQEWKLRQQFSVAEGLPAAEEAARRCQNGWSRVEPNTEWKVERGDWPRDRKKK